jgi:hypothetical protein
MVFLAPGLGKVACLLGFRRGHGLPREIQGGCLPVDSGLDRSQTGEGGACAETLHWALLVRAPRLPTLDFTLLEIWGWWPGRRPSSRMGEANLFPKTRPDLWRAGEMKGRQQQGSLVTYLGIKKEISKGKQGCVS